MLCECQTVLYLYLCFGKRYFILDQQIARHFVQYSGCLYTPSPIMQLKKLTPFLLQGSQPITIKGNLANWNTLCNLVNVPPV